MRCPQCQSENSADARFCSACGSRLEAACPACGSANAPGSRFCSACGRALTAGDTRAPAARLGSPEAYTPRHLAEKILTSRAALEGERKQVTVLFVDVSGFTALSERLDPEDVHRLMTRAFELMLDEVHRYEGTVNQFLGDGIMALFGAPIAHEDHARRAVHAALGIRTALERYQEELRATRGIGFQVRQGLNTGLVVVGSIGTDLRMDYTAVGDTTNVAARLQQAADPGRIVVSEGTHRLVAGYSHTRPLGELALKGKAEPVQAWEVISARAARSRLEVEGERGLTPFVGRDRELRLLSECFDEARAGRGQVVFLVGEAGIGKSRLLFEFQRGLGEAVTWVEGHCLSFGHSIAFYPLVDLLRRTFRIEEGDGESEIVQKIERAVLRFGEDLRPTLPWLRTLLAVDPGDPAVAGAAPPLRRGETFDAVRRLLLRAAEVRPQVVVYEDVHWIDRATEEYVRRMADSIATSRVLMILTYRPGYANPFGERTYHTRLALSPLPAEAGVRMAEAMLASARLPQELEALITRKAEGNPFFVEEVVKSLQELGALRRAGERYVLAGPLDAVSVPGTIQDVIMARIDRLADTPKKTLQLASVIGREFTRRLLDRLAEVRERTEEVIRELTAIELIYEKSLFPELAYMFKHALTQDVAYGSLLVQRRRELHRLIGRAIEELYADRLAEHFEVLAHHFSRAEEWDKALDYLLKGAEKAAKAFGVREALALYEDALAAADRLGDRVPATTRIAIHRARADLFFAVSEYGRSRAEADQCLALARQEGDRTGEANALVQGAWATFWMEDFPGALTRAREAIEASEAIGAQAPLAGGLMVTGVVHAIAARHADAEAALDPTLRISRAAEDVNREALTLHFLSVIRSWHGRYREGLELGTEGLRIAREHRLLIPLIRCLWNQGVAWTGLGDYEAALAPLREGMSLTEKIGDEGYLARFLNTLAWLYVECGDLDRALELSAPAAEVARKRRHATGGEQLAFTQVNQGDALIAKGDLVAAGEVLEEVHRFATNPATHEWMKWRYTAHCFATLGDLWLARGDPARAEAFADQCLEIAAPTTSRRYIIRGFRVKGESAVLRRRWDEAEAALRQALTLAESIGEPREIWKTHLAVAELEAARGHGDGARQQHQAARAVIDAIRAKLQDAALRAAFERAPDVCRVSALG